MSRRVRVEGDLFHGHIPAGAIYIGRACPGLPRSRYHNPFPVKKYGRSGALERFRRYVDEHPELVEMARRELAGYDLACWCGLKDACHGDTWLDVLAVTPNAVAGESTTMRQVTRVTLAQWAKKVGRAETAVRNHLRTQPGFPMPKGTKPRTGKGKPFEEYDEAELDAFLSQWESEHAPPRYEVPGDPDAYRTLGAIARLIGLDGKSLTQQRDTFDERADHQDRGQRRTYRVGDVIALLNERRGRGMAMNPAVDRRRREAGA
ncbi:DUF4326 domain-containing protein [Nonomuraea sp. NPDC050536]|uniref:DUF4326 domain-containing protein n=1 Tax=Nonomuraea sp. NPDC050536 TaxID=3364366 RepID=UPI0037C54278